MPSLRCNASRSVALLGLWLAALGTARAAPDPAELAQHNGCMVCHGLVAKQVGPGFAQVAARYQNEPGAAVRLADKIRTGGMGNWGRVSMTMYPHLSEADRLLLARWVLAQPPKP